MGRAKAAGKSTSKREAIRMAQDEEHKLRSGTWVDPEARRITFSEYFEKHWLPNKTGEINTIAKYQMHYEASPGIPPLGLPGGPTGAPGWHRKPIDVARPLAIGWDDDREPDPRRSRERP